MGIMEMSTEHTYLVKCRDCSFTCDCSTPAGAQEAAEEHLGYLGEGNTNYHTVEIVPMLTVARR